MARSLVALLALAAAVIPSEVEESASAVKVEIVGTDYAFRVPAPVKAGRTTFTFTNKGKQFHEFNINLLARGVTMKHFMDSVHAGKPTAKLREGTIGVLFADAGKTSVAGLSTTLLPGRDYVVICIMRDSAKAPRHYDMGMFAGFRAEGTSAATTRVQGDTIFATEYAFQYPGTLAPGHHTLIFVNRGKQRHEVSMGLFKAGASVPKMLAVEKAGGDVDALFEAPVGVLHSPAGMTPIGVLDVNLLAGREYLILCEFKDTDSAPAHDKLGMIGSIHVASTKQGKKPH